MRTPRLTGLAPILAGCVLALGLEKAAGAAGPPFSPPHLQSALIRLAAQGRPGTLGVVVNDLRSGRSWRVNSARAYPMMSVFKAPLGATVLSQVDRGTLSLQRAVVVRRQDLMTAGVSRIAADFHGDHEVFTVRQLLAAAVSHSDNTAADVLLEVVGGPQAVTAFLRAHGILQMRVDRDEAAIAREFRLRAGYEAYMRDPRDRATPEAAALFLRKLWRGELLSAASTRRLLDLLYAQTTPERLRAGIPPAVRLADKCGTSYTMAGMTAAFNDIGILTWPDGHTVIVAAFLTGSNASEVSMRAIFESLARTVAAELHPPLRRLMR